MRLRPRLVLKPLWIGLCALAIGVAGYKVAAQDYRLSELLPLTRYDVTLTMQLDGHGQDVRVRTFLPTTDSRQLVSGEQSVPGNLHLTTRLASGGREAVWTGDEAREGTVVRYAFQVVGRPIRFELASDLPVPAVYPPSLRPYLSAEPAIQVDAPEIAQLLAKLGADKGSLVARLRRIYEHASALEQRPFKGMTDALTALRLGEASCNGKSRLLTALARAAGIPARLVGGVIMQRGHTRTAHQWVEAWVAGHWVPLDATNHHFAELPAHYLTLYTGDEVLFKHTAEINFRYGYDVEKTLVPSPRAKSTLGALNVWALFERLHLPFSLLRTLLTLPIGALVVVLFRNVIGLSTFGTFLPALIAAAASETGPLWGFLGLLIVIISVSLGRWALHKLELLHSPTLAILLTLVAASMLATSLVAERLGLVALTRISLFPIAVLAITAERLYLAVVDQGVATATKQLASTFAVIAACYVVMSSLVLQIIVIGFPEVLLLCVAINLYLGRWVGMRLLEYRRFRHVLAPNAGVAS